MRLETFGTIILNRHHKPILDALLDTRAVNIRRCVALSLAVGATLSGAAPQAFAQGVGNAGPVLAQATPAAPIIEPRAITPSGTTILPTDVLPLPTIQNRMTFGENLQLRVLQKLPARFYFTSTVESSFRYETNVFQFPRKSIFVRQLSRNANGQFNIANLQAQTSVFPSNVQISQALALVNREDRVFRVLPNVTGGFAITPRTRILCNWFMIRDSLFNNTRLNTTIQSIAYGAQHDIPLGQRASMQLEIQARELFQPHQQPVFDFLPGITVSAVVTPRTVAFVNALWQLRGKKYFQAPHKEMDPFYTWGLLHQRGGWSFSASTTFVQNFREPFASAATIRQNNYSFISDFEVARRLFRQLPGLQAFIRAEPIWNMKGRERPGLAGIDFRLYWGLRMSVSKPALTSALDSLRRQLEEQEVAPPAPPPSTSPTKPSAHIQPHQVIAASPQPMHGFLTESGEPDTVANAGADALMPVRATIADQISDAESEITPVSDSTLTPAVGLAPDQISSAEATTEL